MKRFLSIFLCAVMLLGLLPAIPAVSAAADTQILTDDFESYGSNTTVTTSVKGWDEFNARCHSLVTESGNTYAKLARGLTSTGGVENSPRARKNVAAVASDIYMIQADVKVSEKGLLGIYARATSSLSLVRFGGNVLLNGANTGYKTVKDQWLTFQLFFKMAENGDSMDVYLRMWGDGVTNSNGNAVSASAPVMVSKTITSNLNLSGNATTWLFFQGAFSSGTENDYAALDNVTMKKIGEELTDLSTLTVNGEEVPGFSPDKTTYDLELDYGITEAIVAATAGTGKTVTIDCPTVTDFPRGVNITVTNDTLGISKTYTVNLTVSSTADFDLLLSDDFESYGTAEKVTNSIKGWSAITAANHSLVTDGDTRALKFSIAGTTEKYPRARKNITAQVGDTIQAQADFKLSENGYIGLYLRNNSKVESIHLLKNTDVLINGSSTGYEIEPGKWFTCNTHIKLAANGGLMEIYMCLWGEGVVDREGNAATKENPVKLSRTVNTSLNVESVSTVTIDFGCNFSKGDETDYALVDNVVMTRLHSDVAGITNLTVNETEVEAVEGTDNQFSIMLPYGTEKAVILAEAGYGRTVTLSEAVVTTFPTDVTVTVNNASAGVSKTYIVSVDAKRTENQMEGTLMLVYGGANGIFTMSYDDGLYETAAYLDQIGAKYDVYSSAMMVTSKLSKADRAKWQLLFDRGYIEPQNHSMTHLVLPNDDWAYTNGTGAENNTPENYQYQIVDSKDLLEEYFGNDIIFFAASNNTLSSGAYEVVKDSHYAARLGALGVNSLDPTEGTNPGQWYNLKCVWFSKDMEEIILPHIDIAAQQGGWFVGGCHSIGNFDREGDVSVEDAERIFAYVSAYQKENKLWATTVSNAIKYVRERQNSRCYVDWVGGNVIVEVVSNGVLDKEVFDHALTVKAQIPAGWNQVKYTCNGEEFVADVFEEDGKYWAYINVLPDTRVVVRDARNYDVLFTENFDDLNISLGDTFTSRGWHTATNNSYLSYNGIIGEKDIQYTGAGAGDYYPRVNAITEAKVGDTYVITGDLMRGAGATAYVYLYNAVANTSHAVFYINDNGVYFADSKMACTAVNDQWIHYEISVVLGENGEVCPASIVLYGGVKDASGNPITASKPFTYSKNITMKAYDITANGALRISFASKVNATTSYTRWDNMVLGVVENDAVVLDSLKINGETVDNFYNTITEYDVKLDGAATITATAPEGCTVVIDKETVNQYPATVKITVTKGTVTKVYTLNLSKKLSGEKDSQILPVYGGADSIVTMTFDDGYYDSVEILNQLLATYNLKASAMMIAERVNDSNVQQWIDLFNQGYVEPQNHSMTHLNLKDNPTDENYQIEVLDSQTRLENYFGNDIIAYAAAYNVLSDGAWETVMDSHYAARLGAYGINDLDLADTTDAGGWYNLYNVPFKKTNVNDQYSYLVNNLNRAVEEGKWLLTMCHGVGAGTNSEITEATADALFAQIARLQEAGKVWNATFSEAVKYLRQYQNMTSHAQWIGGDVYVSLENNGIVLPEDVFDQAMTVQVQVPEDWKTAVTGKNESLTVFAENGKAYVLVDVIPGETVRLTNGDAQDAFAEEVKFSGANVTLQSDMSVSFKVKAALLETYSAPYAEFVLNGAKVTVDTYTRSGDYYLFTFRNIAPDKVGDTIYATLHATKDGVVYQGKTSEYSVAQYCYNMLEKCADDMYAEFRTLLVDLLNYAATSQLYTGHHTDALANEALTDAQKLWGTQTDPTLTHTDLDREYAVVDGATASWAGAALVLEDSVTMRLKLKTDSLEGLTVRITDGTSNWTVDASSFVEYESGRYYVYFKGLHAGQMRTKVYITVYNGDVAVSNTLCYSIASYAYSQKDADPTQYPGLAELVKAMMRYGDAAEAYIN